MSHTTKLNRILNIALSISLILSVYPAQLWGSAAPIQAVAVESAELPKAISRNEPAALSHPVALSRVQSAYTSGSTVVISYTVTNNLLPTLTPAIAGAGDVTATVAALTGYSATDDMNTQRNIELALTLTNGTLVDANGASVNGNTLTWQLPDLPPFQSQTVSVTVAAPATSAGFTELDSGALLSAELFNNPIMTTARPAVVIPDAVSADTVAATVEVDTSDDDMLWKSAEFGQDPLAAFGYVQAFDFDPYRGSLRGTRGTLWNAAGNSLDQSTLLIAMLRAAGIPAHYRHGQLSETDAQTLIASMFPADTGVAGYISNGAEVSDPINDADLIALVRDHWWVEAYLPSTGAWTDLDPSFANAAVGDSFATPGTHDRVLAVPTSEQHMIELGLRIEQYTAFPSSGSHLQTSYPVTASLPIAQVAAKRLVFSHFTDEDLTVGLAFAARQITYHPYFGIEENDFAVLGDAFEDLFSNFPFSTKGTVAGWIEYKVTDPDGNSETFERVIKDNLGPDFRLNGGSPNLSFDTNSLPFFAPGEEFVHWVLPNDVPEWAFERRVVEATADLEELGTRTEAMLDLIDEVSDPLTVEQNEIVNSAIAQMLTMQTLRLSLNGLQFAQFADDTLSQIADGLHTNLFYSAPRIFAIYAPAPTGEDEMLTVDLRTTRVEAIVAPGQAAGADKTAQWLKGVAESQLEGDTLERMVGEPVITTERTFAEMHAQGIEPVKLTPDDIDQLELYPFSADARAYILQALLEGKTVIAPSDEVMVNGEIAWTWWEIDPETGETISVGENGLHVSALTWTMIKLIVEAVVEAVIEFIISAILSSLGLNGPTSGPGVASLAEQCMKLGEAVNEMFMSVVDAWPTRRRSQVEQRAVQEWMFLPAHQCPIDNCGIEQFVLPASSNQTIPLPEMAFSYAQNEVGPTEAGERIAVTDNGSGGAPALTLATNPTASTISAADSANFDAELSANFADTIDLLVHAPPNWSVAITPLGAVTATPNEGVLAGDYTILLVGQAQSDRSVVASAEHTVTVTSAEALGFDVIVEPNITIPQNAALFSDVSNQTNDGEAEIPDSAYRVDIDNQSPTTKTYTVDVSGAPVGWIVLDGQQQTSSSVTLPPGTQTTLGLYVMPDALPAPGTSHTIDIDISDGGALNDTAQFMWEMPGQAHNYVTIAPDTLYVGSTDSVSFTLAMENVGNVAGTFPISASIPVTHSFSNLLADMTLAAGADDSAEVTLNVTGASVGQRYPLQVSSPAPNSYTQYAFADVIIVSPDTEKLFGATTEIAACSADAVLEAHFNAVGSTTGVLEGACSGGSCNSQQRDDVVNSVNQLVGYINTNFPTVDTSAASAAAAVLSTANTAQENLDAIPAIADSVSALADPVCHIAETQPDLQWTPVYDAILTNDTMTYTLDLTNLGTVASSYALTVELPSGTFTDNPTVNPSTTMSYDFPISSASAGLIEIPATVVADGSPLSNDNASAFANVVDQFIQLMAVNPTPNFVETGSSQSTIFIDVANFANIPIVGDAVVEVVAENGGVVDSAETPIIIRPGNPQSYELATFDTSGYASGVYSVTVDIVDAADSPIDNGSGFNFLGVGQALGAAHYVEPAVVPPGTFMVTTVISTEILAETAAPTGGNRDAAPLWEPIGLRELSVSSEQSSVNSEQLTVNSEEVEDDGEPVFHNNESEAIESGEVAEVEEVVEEVDEPFASGLRNAGRAPTGYTRTENDDAAITHTGSWQSRANANTSAGNSHRSNTVGSAASYDFTGTWVGVGLLADTISGNAEIFIDGASQGVFDLYRLQGRVEEFYFSGLADTNHTISVTVTGVQNPFATNSFVQLDYFDTWDGTVFPGGTFEQDDPAAIYSNGWFNRNDTDASGGNYIRSNSGTAWFPFYGTSVSYQALAYNGSGSADLYIDGVFQHRVELYNATDISRTFSFDGLSNDIHVLTIKAHQGTIGIDVFHVPAITLAYTEPADTGYVRHEEDDTAIRYNGQPFNSAPTSWSYESFCQCSDGNHARTVTPGDTVSIDVNTQMVALGFMGGERGGQVEVFLDGVSQGVTDLYRNSAQPVTLFYNFPISGAHTISATLLPTFNPLLNGTIPRMNFDFYDTWDGSALANGSFEQDDTARILYSNFGWGNQIDIGGTASGGSFGTTTDRVAWIPFTDSSITYQAFARSSGGMTDIYLDGVFQYRVDQYSFNNMTRTFSFDGLSAGVHVLMIVPHSGNSTLDRVVMPAIDAAYTPPTTSGITRYEEHDTSIRYNGQPFTGTSYTWGYVGFCPCSDGFSAESATAGDSITIDFDGTWLNLGFIGDRSSGMAQIVIDGTMTETIDLYYQDQQTVDFHYNNLSPGNHTVQINVLGVSNPLANNETVNFDYYETWDGTSEGTGNFEADFINLDDFHYSTGWSFLSSAVATNGTTQRGGNGNVAWFHFTGESVTYQAVKYGSARNVKVYLDGVYQTTLDLNAQDPMSTTLSFDGLANEAHVLKLVGYRGNFTLDQMIVPAIEPGFVAEVCSGYCRFEEDHSAMRYNGLPFEQTSISWDYRADISGGYMSDGYYAGTDTAGDALSLTFDGEQVAVGFRTEEDAGFVDVYIDGVMQETVDTYSRDNGTLLRIYPVNSGTHTISMTQAITNHPNARDDEMYIDFIDVWDGTSIPSGMFEAEDIYLRSQSWVYEDNAVASDGRFWRTSNAVGGVWIPFEGDSVQFDAIAFDDGDPWTRVYVDGVEQDQINLWSNNTVTRTFALDGFGAGVHLLHIQSYRDQIAIDTVTTPATDAAYSSAIPMGMVRYEEDALTYGSDSYTQRSRNWDLGTDNRYSSYKAVFSNDAGETASLTFDGSWVNLGLYQYAQGGSAEIRIDGNLVQTVNLDNPTAMITETNFTLADGTHTVEITVVGDGFVGIDFIDIYDGSPVADRLVDPWLADTQSETQVHLSNAWVGIDEPVAIGDHYMRSGTNAWFTFVGDSVTFYGFTNDFSRLSDIYIDGQYIETVDYEYDFTDLPIAFHYNNLGDGPHTLRIQRVGNGTQYIDGFVTPATNVPYAPMVEWYDDDPAGNGAPLFGSVGMGAGIATGDLDLDGIPELVFGSDTTLLWGRLYVYNADGSDSGDGDAIKWTDDIGGPPIDRAWIGTPALGNLDDDPQGEIVVLTSKGLRVYEHDGALKWMTDTVGVDFEVNGAPALGNLDADPEPEIVINGNQEIVVFDADGTRLWSVATPYVSNAPMLADLNGDTVLDIFFTDFGNEAAGAPATAYLYDFNFGAPNMLWSVPITPTIQGFFGSQSIGDIDGQQPGGDDGPEIVISQRGAVTVLDDDGSTVWSTPIDVGNPGGVSLADLDGDGEVEILTGTRTEFETGRFGKLFALNADGTILWDAIAEDSSSANSASVLDLNGDGIFEVAWNGKEQGITIYSGIDGSVIYNDPRIFTLSGSDYPIIVDVDADDSAEIVVPTLRGPRIIGMDGVWGEARSIWNQQTYHINNVNDDLSIPFSEFNSWDSHNTYHTQYPSEFALPIFGINISHEVGTEDLAVSDFSVVPDVSNDPNYQWNYVQTVVSPTVTRTLDSVLTNLTPGETRMVASGTVVSYTLTSGQNQLVLPPLYVSVAKLIAIEPFSQTVAAGSTAMYSVTLTNPTDMATVYDLDLRGLGDPVGLVDSVNVPANSSVEVVLTIDTTAEMDGVFDFTVSADSGSYVDSANAQLIVFDALDLSITPTPQSAAPGQTRSYSLTVTNNDNQQQTVQLSAVGLPDLTLPADVVVAANDSATVVVEAKGYVAGQLPFSVTGVNDHGATDGADAVLDVTDGQDVSLVLNPDPMMGGPGMPSAVIVMVTNDGSAVTTYDLSVDVLPGWTAQLAQDEVMLSPFVLNSAEIQLTLTPPVGTVAASYPYSVTATAQTASRDADQPASTTAVGTVDVGQRGIQIGITPPNRLMQPTDSATWNVTITNTGDIADTYWMTMTGIVALSGQFSQDSVTLNAGESTTIQLLADDFTFALPIEYTFAVAAISQADGNVLNEAQAKITISNEEAVEVSYFPDDQVVDPDETAFYVLTVTNTGNLVTEYVMTFGSTPRGSGVSVSGSLDRIFIPAHSTVVVYVNASADAPGTYNIDGSAESPSGTNAQDTALLFVRDMTAVESVQMGSNTPTVLFAMLLVTVALAMLTLLLRRRKR